MALFNGLPDALPRTDEFPAVLSQVTCERPHGSSYPASPVTPRYYGSLRYDPAIREKIRREASSVMQLRTAALRREHPDPPPPPRKAPARPRLQHFVAYTSCNSTTNAEDRPRHDLSVRCNRAYTDVECTDDGPRTWDKFKGDGFNINTTASPCAPCINHQEEAEMTKEQETCCPDEIGEAKGDVLCFVGEDAYIMDVDLPSISLMSSHPDNFQECISQGRKRFDDLSQNLASVRSLTHPRAEPRLRSVFPGPEDTFCPGCTASYYHRREMSSFEPAVEGLLYQQSPAEAERDQISECVVCAISAMESPSEKSISACIADKEHILTSSMKGFMKGSEYLDGTR